MVGVERRTKSTSGNAASDSSDARMAEPAGKHVGSPRPGGAGAAKAPSADNQECSAIGSGGALAGVRPHLR